MRIEIAEVQVAIASREHLVELVEGRAFYDPEARAVVVCPSSGGGQSVVISID